MMPPQYPGYLAKETTFPGQLANGAKSMAVRRVQEWLCFHGVQTSVDNGFGDATEQAVKSFQTVRGLTTNGKVDANTWKALVAPLHAVVADLSPPGSALDGLCLRAARQHLKQHPIEIGGDNRGPWVRAYMNGNDGPGWFWCAGFVTFLLSQATLQLGVAMPIPGSISCDTLAAQARKANRYVSGTTLEKGKAAPDALGKCFIFLVRRSSSDWTHTGLGFNLQGNTFSTIEGNTNDDGGRNGFEVCSRTRSVPEKDFIVIA